MRLHLCQCVLHVYSSLACTVRQEAHLVALRQADEHTSAELAELSVSPHHRVPGDRSCSEGHTRVRDGGDGACLTSTGRYLDVGNAKSVDLRDTPFRSATAERRSST